MDVFATFMERGKIEQYHNSQKRRVLRTSDVRSSRDEVRGLLESGEYGYTAQLIDIQTERLAHKRGIFEAQLIPLYFLLLAPAGVTRGCALFQRFGKLGVFTLVAESFKAYFKTAFPDYRISFHPTVPTAILRRYFEEGDINEMTLNLLSVPRSYGQMGSSLDAHASHVMMHATCTNER